jgi:hypothetical protein
VSLDQSLVFGSEQSADECLLCVAADASVGLTIGADVADWVDVVSDLNVGDVYAFSKHVCREENGELALAEVVEGGFALGFAASTVSVADMGVNVLDVQGFEVVDILCVEGLHTLTSLDEDN